MNILYKIHDFSDGSLLGFLRPIAPIKTGDFIVIDGNRYKVEHETAVATTETIGGNPMLLEGEPVRVLDVVDVPDQLTQ